LQVSGFDEFARRFRQEFEAAEGFLTPLFVELAEHGGDQLRLEHFLLTLDADAGGREAEIDAAGVLFTPLATDVAAALEAVGGERHGGCGDAHVAGEIEHRRAFDIVEVIEDACLMSADDVLSFFVADVAAVAGEVDLGVTAEDQVYFGAGHVGIMWAFSLSCQIKLCKLTVVTKFGPFDCSSVGADCGKIGDGMEGPSMMRGLIVLLAAGVAFAQTPPVQQAQPPAQGAGAAGRGGQRPQNPTRDAHTPGYVDAKELPDGEVPAADVEGNFIIGPTHNPAAEMTVRDGVPQGNVIEFTMESTDSKIYPGIARAGRRQDPNDPTKFIIDSHPAPYTRKVAVYVPKQYVPGTEAPFIVGADGPDKLLFTALDNLIAEKKVPVMIAVSIANGSGDAQGSERGLEYDTMSGLYAEFVEKEVLPRAEKEANVKLTKDPDGRATMGGSSGGSAALEMAWYHTDLYHRVLTYSGTYVNQQWPENDSTPHGAWEFHEHLIPNSPVKPIRIWMEVGDRDNFGRTDGYHDWVLANENMAKVLAAKGYHYQFIFAVNAGHTDGAVKRQTLPEALEWVWRGYRAK
jgi:iron(III)-enterobactin esterase